MNDVIPVKTLAVARPPRRMSVPAVASALALLGMTVFFVLASSRAETAQMESELPPLAGSTATNPAPLAPAIPPSQQPFQPTPIAPVPATVQSTPAATGTTPVPLPATPPPIREGQSARPPILIVDLAQASSLRSSPPSGSPAAGTVAPSGETPQQRGPTLSDSERFSARVSGEQVEVAEAVQLPRLHRLVPQGAIIGAVMETALNSDLPGFARAIVQRDVLSFDGSSVLIPAGSRVIGQYESGVAQGASRIFIVWTRLIRPDGVSIALASPAVDDLGRGGVAGKVNRHFLQRFGGSILLSVLTGGINAATAAATSGSTVVVSSSSEASGFASQASRDLDIPPTIKTRQGASVRIFVARDLDFTRVGPAK